MLRKKQAFGAAVLCALVASVACSSSSSDDSGSGGMTAGAGGSSGNSGSAGRGGSGGRAGSSGSTGKAGSSAGKGGTSSATAGEGGAGGEGGAPVCPGCASGFCLTDGTCVDCLPSNDHCPDNQYCTDANKCAPGCKTDGSNCASGICSEQHDCKNCINDSECSDGHLCGGGVCAAACTADQESTTNGCTSGLTCCSAHCVDTQTDSTHCGACGATCADSQFCGVTASGAGGAAGAAGAGGATSSSSVGCHETVLANVCAITKVIVISDTGDPDSTPPPKNSTDGNLVPARAIGSALNAQCPSQPAVTEERQDTPDALNITTGHPVSGGGTLLVVAGGPFFQNLENYFEQSSSPLYVTSDGTLNEFLDRGGDVIASDPISIPGDPDHVSHDLFIVQFMRDVSSGSLVLNAQGFWQSGTTAAAFEVANTILPNLSTYDKAWYAFDWTDANDDKLPQANEITQQKAAP